MKAAYRFAGLLALVPVILGLSLSAPASARSHEMAAQISYHHAAVARAAQAERRAARRAKSSTTPPRLFGTTSVWNLPVNTSTTLDPASGPLMAAFNTEVTRQIAARTGPWISTTNYSTPLYTVASTQPRVPLTLDTGTWGNTLRSQLSAGVPIPPDSVAAKGTDGHLTVWQPSTNTLWEFWKAKKLADGWHASWGGVMRDVSTSPGHFRNRSDAAGNVLEQANWGATGTSLPVLGGTVTVAEARYGRISHALALNIPDACAHSFSWPAQRTDGKSTAADCLPEGAHLRLDPTLDLSKLQMPRFTRLLAEAAQRYGVIVRDRTGVATGFFCEDPAQHGSDVWAGGTGTDGLLGAKPWNLVWRQFPWDRMQLLPMALTSR